MRILLVDDCKFPIIELAIVIGDSYCKASSEEEFGSENKFNTSVAEMLMWIDLIIINLPV